MRSRLPHIAIASVGRCDASSTEVSVERATQCIQRHECTLHIERRERECRTVAVWVECHRICRATGTGTRDTQRKERALTSQYCSCVVFYIRAYLDRCHFKTAIYSFYRTENCVSSLGGQSNKMHSTNNNDDLMRMTIKLRVTSYDQIHDSYIAPGTAARKSNDMTTTRNGKKEWQRQRRRSEWKRTHINCVRCSLHQVAPSTVLPLLLRISR